ncbi:hypothetical protein Goarm_012122 [Gossypium armourianum]|uniref:Uncharacterized protein n=1 Tax=Gossypium armourianum TaxID=34283 RepID=A0A7J9IYX5_9ROSI|nr:hypothetical protein [Gossypium armourianum]
MLEFLFGRGRPKPRVENGRVFAVHENSPISDQRKMADVEDQAANVSAEEQIHFTTIQTLQNDILSAKSMKQQLMEDIEKMLTAKGQLCSLIIEKQRKIASLDSDSTTLAQVISLSLFLITLELIQHEKISLSSKLIEKRTGSNPRNIEDKWKSMIWYITTSSMLSFV